MVNLAIEKLERLGYAHVLFQLSLTKSKQSISNENVASKLR